jgi:EAL domain-containing protein (putative c-di-GMP-specific phosphodiesterase class I)
LAASYSRPDCQRQFPINALKIDPLFVNLITRNTGNTTVVTAVISIGISPGSVRHRTDCCGQRA